MPTPSKFTEPVRRKILQALQVGASLETAAAVAVIGDRTLRRWLEQGQKAAEGSSYRKFYLAAQEAQAHPRVRALGIVYEAMADKPELAKWYLERREHGFAPPMPHAAAPPAGPVVIQLSLSDGRPVALAETVIEVGALEQDETTGALPDPAPLASA